MDRVDRNEPILQHGGLEARNDANRAAARLGAAYGIAAFTWWGLCPVYFKAVAQVPALEVLAHRVIWSVVLLAILIGLQKRWGEVRSVLRERPTMLRLGATTVLIANNWGIFIWAVANGELLQASLGYFINPLINVLLGVVLLRERLRRMQMLSVVLAAVGVGYMIVEYGEVPWIALLLAFSFAFYGLLRKTARAEALVGLTVETTLLAPLALAFLFYKGAQSTGSFAAVSWQLDVLLASAGIITAVPLIWFTAAARRLRYSTLGFIQYLAPTGQFLLAVLAFGEPFTRDHLITFAFIWTALAIYSADTALQPRRLEVRDRKGSR
jgi:chloramphenicol-sensitive protein RarD